MNILTFSQFFFAIGNILLIRAVIKDRNLLKGYDLIGSFLTLMGMTFVQIYFLHIADYIGFIIGTIQWTFWLFVVVFVLRLTRQRRN